MAEEITERDIFGSDSELSEEEGEGPAASFGGVC